MTVLAVPPARGRLGRDAKSCVSTAVSTMLRLSLCGCRRGAWQAQHNADAGPFPPYTIGFDARTACRRCLTPARGLYPPIAHNLSTCQDVIGKAPRRYP